MLPPAAAASRLMPSLLTRGGIITSGVEAGYEILTYKVGHPSGPFTWLGQKAADYFFPPDNGEISGAGKPGPMPSGTGPHNQTIARRIQEIQQQNPKWVHKGGGNMTEEYIPTPGGKKGARRPDITFERPDGSRYRENVGKRQMRDGRPIRRERDALDDLQRQTGTRPNFTPYN